MRPAPATDIHGLLRMRAPPVGRWVTMAWRHEGFAPCERAPSSHRSKTRCKTGHEALLRPNVVPLFTAVRRLRVVVEQRLVEQQPRLAPIAPNRAFGDLAERGDLGERKAAEEVQVDQLSKRGV